MTDNRDFSRPKTPAPLFVEPEDTGVHVTVEDRNRIRRSREPSDRFDHIEKKQDAHDERLVKVEVTVAGMAGKLEILPRLTDTMERNIAALQQRDHQVFTQKTTVETALTVDAIDKKRTNRKLIAAAATAGMGLVELLHRLLG